MTRVEVGSGKQSVRDFFIALGRVREPVEVVLDGALVAKIIPPNELSDAEKEEILRKGRAFVERARARNKGIPAREIAKTVKRAAKRVRSKQ